jgi:hypothetical protein
MVIVTEVIPAESVVRASNVGEASENVVNRDCQ